MLYFLIAAFFAEAIGTFTGFGATTILLPIASLLMPIKEAIVLVGVFHFFGTAFRTILFARRVNLKIALLFGIPSLIFSYLGASLLSQIDPVLLTKAVGIFLIIFAVYNLFKEKISLPKSPSILVSGGVIVGFIAGLIGTAGAMRGAFLTSWGLAPEVYLGTGALMGLGADATRVLAYFNEGLTGFISLQSVLLLIAIAFFGSLLGRTMVLKTKKKIFATVVFIALLLAGARLLFV